MTKWIRYPKEKYIEFINLNNEGKKVQEISQILKIPYRTICNWKYYGRIPYRLPYIIYEEDIGKCKDCKIELTKENRQRHERLCKICSKKRHQKIKIQVFQYYCQGEPKCMNPECGVPGSMKDIRALTIDHIHGGGHQHRLLIKNRGMYEWLIRNDFPPGYQVLCMNCQFIKRYK